MRINKVLAERVSERGERIARNEAHKMHNETWRRRATAKKKPLKMRHSSKRYFFKNDFTLFHLLQPLHSPLPPPQQRHPFSGLHAVCASPALASVAHACRSLNAFGIRQVPASLLCLCLCPRLCLHLRSRQAAASALATDRVSSLARSVCHLRGNILVITRVLNAFTIFIIDICQLFNT